MTVDACFVNVFCRLGDAVVQTVNTTLLSTQAAIQAEVVNLTFLIAASGIELIPLQVLSGAAAQVVAQTTSIARVIPVAEAGGCLPVGELVQGVTTFLAQEAADAEQALADANRWLARQTELEERKAALEARNDRLSELRFAFPAPC